MMAAGSVHVAMTYFFRSGRADFHYFDLKIQVYAGQRMVGVDGDLFQPDIGHGNNHSVVGMKLHAFFNLLIAECGTRHLLDEPFIADTIPFLRGDLQFEFGAFFLSLQSFFHARDKISFAVKIVKGVTAGAAVEHCSAIVG